MIYYTPTMAKILRYVFHLDALSIRFLLPIHPDHHLVDTLAIATCT